MIGEKHIVRGGCEEEEGDLTREVLMPPPPDLVSLASPCRPAQCHVVLIAVSKDAERRMQSYNEVALPSTQKGGNCFLSTHLWRRSEVDHKVDVRGLHFHQPAKPSAVHLILDFVYQWRVTACREWRRRLREGGVT
jgi:hypothetical protein